MSSTPSRPSRSSRPLAPAAQASAAARSACGASRARARTATKAGRLALGILALTFLPGCYLAHLAAGEAHLLHAARPIDQVLGRADTDAQLRARLALVGPTLDYARRIGLEVGRQYRTYAPWPGDRVVTAVVATRPGEIDPAGFWFPLLGRLPYKGFFDLERARDEAARLSARGLDVCLVPVPAYSTLGWLPDPVPGPLVRRGAGFLVETLIHELVHATVFVAGDARFDEGVATFIGQEGAVRFFAEQEGEAAARVERQRVEDERAVARALAELRSRVAALYAERPVAADRAERRARLSEQARAALAALPLVTLDAAAVARTVQLHDACLALAGTYEADLDAYAARLADLGGNLAAFVAAVRSAAESDHPRQALGLPPRAPGD